MKVVNQEARKQFEKEGMSGQLFAALSLQDQLLELEQLEELGEKQSSEKRKIVDSLMYYKAYKLTEEENVLLSIADLPQWELLAVDSVTVVMTEDRISYLILSGYNILTESEDSAIIWKNPDIEEFMNIAEKSRSCFFSYENELGL